MKKVVFRVVFIIALVALLGSVGYIGFTYIGYVKDAKVYDEASDQFVTVSDTDTVSKTYIGAAPFKEKIFNAVQVGEDEWVHVDFSVLSVKYPDVVGWIYCPGTVINYPVLQTDNNDYYLHHNYLGDYTAAGSIFVECANDLDFVDSNTIIYGHHMKDGSMFASLSKWTNQEYFDEHPKMYLFTKDVTYEVELFSAYATEATSDSYCAILSPCEEMDEYLQRVSKRSKIKSDVELDGDAQYIMLSTCAYMFENARSVVHGKLVPIRDWTK